MAKDNLIRLVPMLAICNEKSAFPYKHFLPRRYQEVKYMQKYCFGRVSAPV